MEHPPGRGGACSSPVVAALVVVLALGALASPRAAPARDFDAPGVGRRGAAVRLGRATSSARTRRTTRSTTAPSRTTRTRRSRRRPSNLYDERYDLFGFPQRADAARRALHPRARTPGRRRSPASTRPAPGSSPRPPRRARSRSSTPASAGAARAAPADRAERRASCPPPRGRATSNGNGVVDVQDFEDDSTRATRRAGAGRRRRDSVDAQDLIREFSRRHRRATATATSTTSPAGTSSTTTTTRSTRRATSRRATTAPAARTRPPRRANDGAGRARRLPALHDHADPDLGHVRRRTRTTFAMGIVYAADNGAEVIEGANGSALPLRVRRGRVAVRLRQGRRPGRSRGDDLNTGNHNYPANYDHTMLIEGVATDIAGPRSGHRARRAEEFLAVDPPRRRRVRQPGPRPHVLPRREHDAVRRATRRSRWRARPARRTPARRRAPPRSSSAPRASAASRSRRTRRGRSSSRPPRTSCPGNTVGAGLPDFAQRGLGRALRLGPRERGRGGARRRRGEDAIPPEASIGDPDWYEPLAGATAQIRASPRAACTGGLHMEARVGPRRAARRGRVDRGAQRDVVRRRGDRLRRDRPRRRSAPSSRATRPPPDPGSPIFKPGSPHPYTGQFTVRAHRHRRRRPRRSPGVDRKVLTAVEPAEQRLRDGFPKQMGTGGEAPLRYADLDGDNAEELLVPLEDGRLHAYRPDGSELPGWPVETRTMAQAAAHAGTPGLSALPPAREPLRGPVVGDLTGDGSPEVVTAAGRHVYAWHADGSPMRRLPRQRGPRATAAARTSARRTATASAASSPALPSARLEGPDAAAADRRPRARRAPLRAAPPTAARCPGSRCELVDPDEAEPMLAESINQPAIGDLDGDGTDDVVVATNEVYGADAARPRTIAGPFSQSLAELLGSATDTSSRVYAVERRDRRRSSTAGRSSSTAASRTSCRSSARATTRRSTATASDPVRRRLDHRRRAGDDAQTPTRTERAGTHGARGATGA